MTNEQNGSDGPPGHDVDTQDAGDTHPSIPVLKRRGRPRTTNRTTKRAILMPASQLERLITLAYFFRRLYTDSGLTGEEIAEAAKVHMPTLGASTVRRLNSPIYLTEQPGVSWVIIDAVVQALGSSHAELDAALRHKDVLGEEGTYATRREAEQERALVRAFRSLPAVAQQFLLEDAQRYVRRSIVSPTAQTPLSEADLEERVREDKLREASRSLGDLSRRAKRGKRSRYDEVSGEPSPD